MTKNKNIVIVDYGLGNTHSIIKAFENPGLIGQLGERWKEVKLLLRYE